MTTGPVSTPAGARGRCLAAEPACRAGGCEQLLTQAAASPVEAHLGRGLADAELSGNLLVRQVVDVPEHDHHPHLVRKLRQRLDKTLAVVGRPGRGLRVALRTRLENLEIVVELHVGGPPALGHESRRAVHGDAMQPSPKGRVAPELAQLAESAQIGLLQHVARVVLVAHQTQRQGIAVARSGTHQVLEGRPVPVPGKLDEVGEVVGLAVQRVSL